MYHYHTHGGHYGLQGWSEPIRHGHTYYGPHVHPTTKGALVGAQRTGYNYPYNYLLPPLTNVATQYPYHGYGGWRYY